MAAAFLCLVASHFYRPDARPAIVWADPGNSGGRYFGDPFRPIFGRVPCFISGGRVTMPGLSRPL